MKNYDIAAKNKIISIIFLLVCLQNFFDLYADPKKNSHKTDEMQTALKEAIQTLEHHYVNLEDQKILAQMDEVLDQELPKILELIEEELKNKPHARQLQKTLFNLYSQNLSQTGKRRKKLSEQIELKGDYSPNYRKQLYQWDRKFREAGLIFTEHGLNRFMGRQRRGATFEKVLAAFSEGTLFYDPKFDTYIRWKDKVTVSMDQTKGWITSVETGNIKQRWILK